MPLRSPWYPPQCCRLFLELRARSLLSQRPTTGYSSPSPMRSPTRKAPQRAKTSVGGSLFMAIVQMGMQLLARPMACQPSPVLPNFVSPLLLHSPRQRLDLLARGTSASPYSCAAGSGLCVRRKGSMVRGILRLYMPCAGLRIIMQGAGLLWSKMMCLCRHCGYRRRAIAATMLAQLVCWQAWPAPREPWATARRSSAGLRAWRISRVGLVFASMRRGRQSRGWSCGHLAPPPSVAWRVSAWRRLPASPGQRHRAPRRTQKAPRAARRRRPPASAPRKATQEAGRCQLDRPG
mmetsp:Transcript_7452/g.23142  ORF Transcript_7452/g.23142 Transcript_7452/m.23142 type:complete len:292 (+) Transcript_7452:809-1684(+)